jgi:Phage capsid family
MAISIAQRVTDAQERLTDARDALQEHLDSLDDNNVTDDQMAVTTTLTASVAEREKALDMFKQAEARLARNSQAIVTAPASDPGLTVRNPRPFAVPAVKIPPQDYVIRSLACMLQARVQQRNPLEVLRERYGEDEPTRFVHDYITRTATVPADTVTSGWASQLVETSVQGFIPALLPNAVYPRLSSMGGKFTFGRAGIVSIPGRVSTPTIAGSFVAQGSPIPVRQGAFTAITFTPMKMAVISVFTRDIAEHSTPSIEGLIRQAIIEDTVGALDTVLLDATAATTTRPAGLRSGVAATTATAAGGITAFIGDVSNLINALITGSNGNLRNPVWIMRPGDVAKAKLLPATAGGGEFPFKDELTGSTLMGYPVIQSNNVTADQMLLVDADDFVSVSGDSPQFSVSDSATVHMEDTTPLAIGTVGAPNTVAAPTRSFWQTDCIGVRMLMDVTWGMRRTGAVAWTQTMTWN